MNVIAMRLFSQRSHGYEAVPLTSEGTCSSNSVYTRPASFYQSRSFHACFLLSVALNCIVVGYISLKGTTDDSLVSRVTQYAGLARDFRVPFNSSSPYGLGSPSDARRSLLWESLDTSAGEISLGNKFAAQVGLPSSAPFFWDPENRSIYLLNAHHSLHCLRKVRRWVTLSQHALPQLDSYPHLIHCMDHLLQNVLCEADDTPMYTSPYSNASTGLGQERMCRSWEKMAAWAKERSACFAYVNETQGVGAVIERYRYCPKGMEEQAKIMRDHFGYSEDWWEEGPEDVESIPRYWEGFDRDEDMTA